MHYATNLGLSHNSRGGAPNSEAEGIKISGPTNKVAGIVRHVSTFVNLIKKIPVFSVAFEKK